MAVARTLSEKNFQWSFSCLQIVFVMILFQLQPATAVIILLLSFRCHLMWLQLLQVADCRFWVDDSVFIEQHTTTPSPHLFTPQDGTES